MNTLHTALLIGTLASSCFGQAFNISFGPNGSRTTAATFGAAADQPGQWNNFTTSGEKALRTTTGELTNVKCTLSGANDGLVFFEDETGNSGEFASLMDDSLFTFGCGGVGQSLFIKLQGLAQGTYRLYIYATRPTLMAPIDSVVLIGFGQSRLAGYAAPNTFEIGRNYTFQTVNVTGSFINNLSILVADSSDTSNISGIQIVPISLTGCTVTQQPENIAAEKDQTISFHASVQGDVRSRQWLKDGQPLADVRGISGSTTNTLTMTRVHSSDNGTYSLRYTCGSQTYTTQAGTLTVNEPPQTCPSDLNQDGGIDGTDVEAFFAYWENGC